MTPPKAVGKPHVTATMTAKMRKISELHPHPDNARQGSVPKIKESLEAFGQVKPIIINHGTHTGIPDQIVAGHHMIKAAKELGWDSVATIEVDFDEVTVKKLMLMDNSAADAATYDDRLLAELLSSLPDLDNTGFSNADLQDLQLTLQDMIPKNPGPDDGPPEDAWRPSNTIFSTTVVFDDADQLRIWSTFTKWLKGRRDEETVAGRVAAFAAEAMEDALSD